MIVLHYAFDGEMLSLAVLSLALAADQEAGYEADNVSVDDLLALMVERGEARATVPMQLNQALSAKVKGTKKKCTATLSNQRVEK